MLSDTFWVKMKSSFEKKREPLVNRGIERARKVCAEIGLEHPTELPIEVLAHMRGALVRTSPASGAKATLLRIGARGVVGVANDLPAEQRRWAIAHELGHFELHENVSYVGLCTGEDMRTDYQSSGHEPEANAFAAELLMPEKLFSRRVDVPKVSWGPIKAAAEEFEVSPTAAAMRFLALTYERVALVSSKQGQVQWVFATRDFGPRIARGTKLDEWSLAYDFFTKGSCSLVPESVSASAWVPNASDGAEVVEHVMTMPRLGMALSLLWFPVSRS